MIVETFRSSGVPINEFYACGGLASNSLIMQIYADVLDMDIRIAASAQTTALGAAMFGAVAAGKEQGGYETILEATKVMGRVKKECFRPIVEHVKVYEELYGEYKTLVEYFGEGGNNVMKNLKNIKKRCKVEERIVSEYSVK